MTKAVLGLAKNASPAVLGIAYQKPGNGHGSPPPPDNASVSFHHNAGTRRINEISLGTVLGV